MQRLVGPTFATMITVFALPGWAQDDEAAKIDALYEALALPQMLEIMREEGLDYGETIATDMFPGSGIARWNDAVSQIYDVEMMNEEVRGAFGEALEGDDIDAMLAFYNSDTGRTIIELEVSARRALLDDAIEQASKDNAALAMADETPLALQVQDFVTANDLIEANVVGALNSNYAFMTGLIDGGAMPPGITPETVLRDVWAQEDEIRANTSEWVYSFLLMAYQPLEAEQMDEYIAFSKSDAGAEINGALFEAFNGMFDDISRALGLAASRFMISQEL
ncbi:DUF2059 domain-containing protein [Cognatiyoonia sp. IB215182]|uniref:DUF2059 domain-containing protein n=1 Tax=Cognatiyoonia sp. IB215182 TaxID=3097353 RepID=UPI002A14B34A|nr:DUF2059 domain-containing protein [Cognatiyoonia sp. IB215182]MDX8353553.1 DUF2059 domain-containing protein [Cognatiyoonia sp. IB215182]